MAGIINIFVDDIFGTGGEEMEQRVLNRLRKEFQVGSEDWNGNPHSFNAHNVQTPAGTDNLLQSGTQFQCCYTFSRCASIAASPTIAMLSLSQQIGETDQVTASQALLATHWTIEKTCIS